MDPIHVIVRPIVTEKATWGSGHQNRFAFEVSKLATKTEIKKAVESLYKVRVLGVATQTRRLRNRAIEQARIEMRQPIVFRQPLRQSTLAGGCRAIDRDDHWPSRSTLAPSVAM